MASLAQHNISSGITRRPYIPAWQRIGVAGTAVLLLAGCGESDASTSSSQETAAADEFTSESYDPAVLERAYPSDGHHDLVPMLSGYDDLLAHHPDVLQRDMDLVVEINHGSAGNAEQRERALDDQYEDMSITMGEGFGENLGAIYIAGREAGELPKIEALLAKNEPAPGRVGSDGSSTNPAKEHWAAQAPRPYNKHPEAIDYFDREGGDAHESTGGAFPSGHTSQAYWQGVTLATVLPELADGILARVSEAGNNRIVLGVHYPTDVMGGRMTGTSIAANRWADEEFRGLLDEARDELVGYLESECGAALSECVDDDTPYASAEEASELFTDRMTYGFEQIGEAGRPLEVPDTAPSLLMSSHPDLNEDQRRQVLELTAIDSGYPLDKSGPTGGWQRIDLLAAMTADVELDSEGNVTLA